MGIQLVPESVVKDTLLVLSPLETPPDKLQEWQLTYTNTVVGADTRTPLFVIPVPNPAGFREPDFTLFDLTHEHARSIRNHVDLLAQEYTTNMNTQGLAGMTSKVLNEVEHLHVSTSRVGGYKVSVAANLTELAKRAPWHRFQLPSHHLSPILSDIKTRYSDGYAFLIAEGEDGCTIDQAGFAVKFACEQPFLPTAHAVQVDAFTGEMRGTVQMDTTCVGLGVVFDPFRLEPPGAPAWLQPRTREDYPYELVPNCKFAGCELKPVGQVVMRCDDLQLKSVPRKWKHACRILDHLPYVSPPGAVHGEEVVQHCSVRLVSILQLRGEQNNVDLPGRRATATDVCAVERMMGDLDAWLVHRQLHPWPATQQEKDAQAAVFQLQNGNAPLPASSRSDRSGSAEMQPGSPSLRALSDMAGYFGMGVSADDSIAQRRYSKIDLALALLARQLAHPGVQDRFSEIGGQSCGSVVYINLDYFNLDLDEDSYRKKVRMIPLVGADSNVGITVDTARTAYLRISATPTYWESIQQRSVG